MAGKAIEQIEFEIPRNPDVPVAYFEEGGPKEWLLVLGLCNVTWLREQRPEVIRRLKNVLEMLEEK
jgi:hypothetical protein